MSMRVKDLLEQKICIDVYDNVCEELGIAFDGPMELTDEGKKHFAEALEFDIALHYNGYDTIAIVDVDDEDENEFERKLALAKELFEAMAGWCSVDEWKLWFKEEI